MGCAAELQEHGHLYDGECCGASQFHQVRISTGTWMAVDCFLPKLSTENRGFSVKHSCSIQRMLQQSITTTCLATRVHPAEHTIEATGSIFRGPYSKVQRSVPHIWYCNLIRPSNATGDRNRGGAIGTFVISHTRRIQFSRRICSGPRAIRANFGRIRSN